jgi:hypothetical protein
VTDERTTDLDAEEVNYIESDPLPDELRSKVHGKYGYWNCVTGTAKFTFRGNAIGFVEDSPLK